LVDLLPSLCGDAWARAVMPMRELGAHEALWLRQEATPRSIARMFNAHPGALPSDFVPRAEVDRHARLALGSLRAAGVIGFGLRIRGGGEYPPGLLDAEHPATVLQFSGVWDIVHTPGVALIGTRQPSPEGIRLAARLAHDCVQAGITVVSGLAQGIDTVAHTRAIEAGGLTMAVLGTPLSSSYPLANTALQRRIARDFLLVSQVPVLRHARQGPRENRLFFAERNATMAALTQATVIVEAGNTSGALIQARHALQQGRALFIPESCCACPELTWPAKFLDRGAIRFGGFEDIRTALVRTASHRDRRDQSAFAFLPGRG